MKIFNGILTIIFILFAALQINDPDSGLWIIFYAAIAAISGFAAVGKYNPTIVLAVTFLCILWMATLLPAVFEWIGLGMPSITGSMKAESPYIEYVREFLGLLISLAALLFLYFQAKKKAV